MKNITYKAEHPIIKEIAIGDLFINERGDIVRFSGYIEEYETLYCYNFSIPEHREDGIIGYSCDKYLRHGTKNKDGFHIKDRYISFKEKIDLL